MDVHRTFTESSVETFCSQLHSLKSNLLSFISHLPSKFEDTIKERQSILLAVWKFRLTKNGREENKLVSDVPA